MGALHNIYTLELKEELVSAMKDIRNNTAQTKMWNTIKNYITLNMKLRGVYSGAIPGTPPVPDPANGPHIWSVAVIPGLPIMNPVDYSIWLLQLRQNFSGTTFIPTSDDTLITATTPIITLPTFNLPQSKSKGEEGDFEKEMERLAGVIVNGLTSDPIAPYAGAAVSTNGGVGSVKFA